MIEYDERFERRVQVWIRIEVPAMLISEVPELYERVQNEIEGIEGAEVRLDVRPPRERRRT